MVESRIKNFVCSALKATLLNERSEIIESTSRGGVIWHLLSYIALHGIEDLWNEQYPNNTVIWLGLRYVDDMIFFIKRTQNPLK